MKRRHKYGAKRMLVTDDDRMYECDLLSKARIVIPGTTFDSKAEAQYYLKLKLLQKAGEVTEIILQPEFILYPGYIRKRDGNKIQPVKYIADFHVTYKDGRQEIIDVKGAKTAEYKLKKKIFEGQYPDLEIKEVSA